MGTINGRLSSPAAQTALSWIFFKSEIEIQSESGEKARQSLDRKWGREIPE